MKKFFLLALLSIFTSMGFAQGIEVIGTVSDNDVAISGADVYIMTIGNVVIPTDTVGTTVTDEDGNFTVDVDLLGDSLFLVASTSACPELLVGFVVQGVEVFVPIDCSTGFPNDSIPESLYIGGVPVNNSGDEWYFFSSVFGEAVSYDWTIDGNSFNTPDVTYEFSEPGTYTASLSVEMASGNTLSDEMSVYVLDIPNCQALFFPFIDSLNNNELVFINASIGDELSYLWDFGDGTESTEAYPTHQFDDSLEYDVCLTISGVDCEDTFCLTVSPSNLFGWTNSGIVAGNTEGRLPSSSQAKDGNGYEFVVVPPASETLSTSDLGMDVKLTTYPNPTEGNAFVNFYSEKSESAQLRVMDMTGKLVLQENVNINSGENQLNLDFGQLTEGVYIMFFESASNQRGVTKIVIQ